MIQNPVKHLRRSFLLNLFAINSTLHLCRLFYWLSKELDYKQHFSGCLGISCYTRENQYVYQNPDWHLTHQKMTNFPCLVRIYVRLCISLKSKGVFTTQKTINNGAFLKNSSWLKSGLNGFWRTLKSVRWYKHYWLETYGMFQFFSLRWNKK